MQNDPRGAGATPGISSQSNGFNLSWLRAGSRSRTTPQPAVPVVLHVRVRALLVRTAVEHVVRHRRAPGHDRAAAPWSRPTGTSRPRSPCCAQRV